MACKYIINGKQYSESETQQVFSSILAVPGNENLSNEELVSKISDLTKDRFVNINLFTPLQETAYTNIIYSEIIKKLGILKPGQEIRIKPNQLFSGIRASLTNDYKRLSFLMEKVTSQEAYDQIKQNQDVVQKFPELERLSYEQIQAAVEQFKNIIDKENFDKFVDLARTKLARVGLRIGADKIEDYGQTYEYYMALAEEDSDDSDEEVEESDRQMDESFEDGRAFRVNVKDTASTRVKLFLSTIPDVEKNVFGKSDFVSYDQVFEDLLQIGSASANLTYNSLQADLIEKSKNKPYLINVAKRIAELRDQKNVQLLNELLTVINKSFTDHVLVLWNSAGDAGVTVKIISSNRNSVLNQIKQDWLENQKRSAIVSKDEIGDLVINKDRVTKLQESLTTANKSKEAAEKVFFVQEFFKAVGIEFTPKMVEYLKERANSGFFRTMGSGSFNGLLRPGGAFDRVLKIYAKNPEGKTSSKYDDINNAMLNDRIFTRFAEIYLEFHGDKYQTGSFRNGENKTIYSYINPSYLETVKKKLVREDGSFLRELQDRSFSRSSEVVEELIKNKGKEVGLFTYRLRYADSLKRDKEDKDAKVRRFMSPKEMLFDALVKHQNNNKQAGFYNMFTLSDKTVTPVIEVTKDSLSTSLDVSINKNNSTRLRDSFNFKKSFSDKLYRLAESEINRILDYAGYDGKEELGIHNFNKANRFFYLFPALNSIEDPTLVDIRNKMFQGVAPNEEDREYLSKVLTNSFKESVLKSFVSMVDSGIINKKEVIDNTSGKEQKIIEFDYPYFDSSYIDRFSTLSSRHKGIMAIADFKYNYLRAQINTLQVLGADPALFYTDKIDKAVKNKAYEQMTTADMNKVVSLTMDEFGKRAAMFIAPGSQGVYEWIDTKGNPVDRTFYDTITIADVKKDVATFKGTNTTDAQEFVTVQEHIDRLMSEGRISLDIWQKITDKIEKSKGKYYELNNEELDVVMQPAKPVHSSNTSKDGFSRVDYVKSSTYPLVPEAVSGSELDKLRVLMETNNIRSANFESAKKTGMPAKALQLFNENGEFIQPSEVQLNAVRQTLTREGLRTQQEIPTQKSEINVVSQMDRQLFEGLLDVSDFSFAGKNYTGRELKKLKEDVRIALFYKNQEELADRMNIKIQNGRVIFKDQRALANLLREEAIERNFDINDIKAIKVNKEGNLIIPIYLMAKGKRFEGLVTSIFTKLVKLKVPGTSLVQVSGVGSKTIKISEKDLKFKNEVIYTSAYDPKKGLQYLRKDKSEIKSAQVFISQYLRDENGKLIDIKSLATKDESGRLIIDPAKLDPKILQLIGARIPNQGHSSMLPIEVAGFLPAFMENTVVVPDGITSQMGSDFDVDKLYAYTSILKYKYNAEDEARINEINDQIGSIKKDYEAQRDALYDMVYPKSVRNTINQLKEAKNKYVEKLKYVNLSQAEKDKKQKRIDGINKILEEVYAAAMTETTEEKLKEANQKKFDLREKLNADIEKLRTELQEVQSKVSGLESFTYDISKYDNTYESLTKMGDNELLQMYKDIHSSVLLHPKTYSKIVRSIDFADIPSESDLFEENGLLDVPDNYIPMDYETQIKSFIDNRSGKLGTGIFAQLISFLAEHQDKDIFLGKISITGEKVITPIKLLKDDGTPLDLYKLTSEGKSDTPFGERSKTDNTSIMLSESVDNTKNKNLYKFDFSVEAMTPLRALISLSSDKNEIVDMRYATRLFSQQIVKDFISILESRRDSLNDNTYVNKKNLFGELSSKYSNLLSDKVKEEYTEGKTPEMLFNPQKLLQLLIDNKEFGSSLIKEKLAGRKISPEDQTKLDDFVIGQLSILNLYKKLEETGQEMSNIMNASNVISSGIGNSLFAAANKRRSVSALAKKDSLFLNLDQILGDITEDGEIITPKGQAGHAMSVAVDFGTAVLSELAPLHYSSIFNDIRSKIVREKSASGSIKNYGKTKYISLSEEIMGSIYSYVFTNPEIGFIDDIGSERKRLLFGDEGEKPLAQRIIDAKEKYKFLETNYFMNRLRPVVPKKGKFSDPYLVQYRTPFSQDIDELANNKGFLELILSGNEELINIARDLVKYSFVTGYSQGAGSYVKFIPIELFMLNDKYMKSMQNFPSLFNNRERFVKQFIQNNPNHARRVPYKIFKSVFMNKLSDDVSIFLDKSKVAEEDLDKLMVEVGSNEGTGKKFPDYLSFYDRRYDRWFLFEKQGLENEDSGIESFEYKRINTLGNEDINEYDSTKTSFSSAFFNNLLYSEKMERLSKNPANPYRGMKLGNIDLYRRHIAMAETATQFIGANINNKSAVIKNTLAAYKDKSNTGIYSAADIVMVSGNNLTDIVPLTDEQQNLDALQTSEAYKILDEVFNKEYTPFIDRAIAAGASFVATNMSGVDQLLKKYLTGKGFTEAMSEMGYIKYVNPAQSEILPSDEDMDNTTESAENINFNNADIDVPAIDLFGSFEDQTEDPEVQNAGSVFGLGFAETVEDPNNAVVVVDNSNDVIENDSDIVSKYIPKADKPMTLKSVLTKLSKNTNNEFYKTLNSIFSKVGYPEVTVVVNTAIPDPGQYDMAEKVIIINPNVAITDHPDKTRAENLENVIMHEVLHAYTADVLAKMKTGSKSLNDRQRMYGASLKVLFNKVVEKFESDPAHADRLKAVREKLTDGEGFLTPADKSEYYGLTSVDEFVSMLFTDAGFQRLMNQTIVEERGQLTALESFKRLLMKLFRTLAESIGIKIMGDSALEQGLNDAFNLITASNMEGGSPEQGTLFSAPTRSIENYSLDTQCK